MILRTKKIFILILPIILFFSILNLHSVRAESPNPTPTPTVTPTPVQDSSKDLNQLQQQIKELENKVSELQGQEKTLSSQITVMNSQIKLTELKINAVKQEIAELTDGIKTATKKISDLERSLNDITKVLLNRIVATYEIGNVQPVQLFVSAKGMSDFFSRVSYLRIVQNHDKELVMETQQAKSDYANQKEIFEDKKKKVETLKKQLESYTLQLAEEKSAKQSLLEVTRNDEKRYQDLLAKARSEFEAIQGIISGKGQETLVGNVPEGQRIASVISGTSCNSGGTHLHFIVSRDGNTDNPFNYLKGGVDYENCSGSSCGSGDADSFSPSGSWGWPLDPKIKLTQGYGATWATKYTWVSQIYNFHNGIDISGSSSDVKAVKEGTLYQGSYAGYNGCRLRYVKVRHKDSGLDTYYLHVNYTFQ